MGQQIVAKIKGVDDFGREQIAGNLYRYSHHYPRVHRGDYMLYFFKDMGKGVGVGIYQVTEETEHYADQEGFQFCSGKMLRWEKQPFEFVVMRRCGNSKLQIIDRLSCHFCITSRSTILSATDTVN